MKCSIQGCPGQYEPKRIVHTVSHGADILVFEDVPAEVCEICSDTLLAPETIQRLEQLMQHRPKPQKLAPVCSYL